MTTNSCRGVYTEVYVYSGASRNSVQPSIPATHLVGEITCTPTQLAFRIDQSKSYLYFSFDRHHVFSISIYKKGKGSFYIAQYPVRWTAQSAVHFLPSLADMFIPTPTRLLSNYAQRIFTHISTTRYSFNS